MGEVGIKFYSLKNWDFSNQKGLDYEMDHKPFVPNTVDSLETISSLSSCFERRT